MKVIAHNGGNRYTVESTANYRWTTKGNILGFTWVYAISRGTQVEVTIPPKEDVHVGDVLNVLPLVNMNRRAFDPCLISQP
jgi:hypothetical protein